MKLIRPARPANEKIAGRPQPVETRGLSSTSSTKNSMESYAAWCADWWRGCFTCPEYMPERVRFCRKWNREVYGVDVVSLSGLPTQNEASGCGEGAA